MRALTTAVARAVTAAGAPGHFARTVAAHPPPAAAALFPRDRVGCARAEAAGLQVVMDTCPKMEWPLP